MDGDIGGRTDELACSPVLALTIQKISINYCSFYLFEGTLIGSEEWPRSPVVTKKEEKFRAGNIDHCSDYTRGYQKRKTKKQNRYAGSSAIARDECDLGGNSTFF